MFLFFNLYVKFWDLVTPELAAVIMYPFAVIVHKFVHAK